MSIEAGEIYYQLEYRHGVDDKRRVSIPAGWRSASEDQNIFYVFLWDKGGRPPCLMVLPPARMRDLMERLRTLSFADDESESLRRLLARSAKVAADKAGRICLPEQLAKAADLGSEVIMKGLMDRFQIWNPDHFEKIKVIDEYLKDRALKLI
jgi:MraZ protein